MSKIVDSLRKKVTILEIDGDACVTKKREYVAYLFSMFLQKYRKCYSAVEVGELKLLFENLENNVHCRLNSTWSVL